MTERKRRDPVEDYVFLETKRVDGQYREDFSFIRRLSQPACLRPNPSSGNMERTFTLQFTEKMEKSAQAVACKHLRAITPRIALELGSTLITLYGAPSYFDNIKTGKPRRAVYHPSIKGNAPASKFNAVKDAVLALNSALNELDGPAKSAVESALRRATNSVDQAARAVCATASTYDNAPELYRLDALGLIISEVAIEMRSAEAPPSIASGRGRPAGPWIKAAKDLEPHFVRLTGIKLTNRMPEDAGVKRFADFIEPLVFAAYDECFLERPNVWRTLKERL